jgi:hypothetical protein
MGKFYKPDDGYDVSRDNRDGYVDEFVKSMERYWEEKRMEEKTKNENEKS